jgi:hypothetical protein
LNRQLGEDEKATFVLTDLHPHASAWEAASKKSDHLKYIPEGVDAANAPKDLLRKVEGGVDGKGLEKKKVMRLFSLAFHHFDDPLAERILKNTIEIGDSFA